MIPKSGNRFSEKIMRKQNVRARHRAGLAGLTHALGKAGSATHTEEEISRRMADVGADAIIGEGMEAGGHIGLQHDPLLYGAYLLNPFLTRVEMVPMLIVNQGEVAVIKAYVGLPTLATSGEEFKFGSIVHPGHRGIWS